MSYLFFCLISLTQHEHFLQALFRKIAAALPGMDSYSSATKSDDMVDVNLKNTSSSSQGEQQGGGGGGGCSC